MFYLKTLVHFMLLTS